MLHLKQHGGNVYWKPNKFIGAILGLLGVKFGLGLFYAGAPRLALALIVTLPVAVILLMMQGWYEALAAFFVLLTILSVVLSYTIAARTPATNARAWYTRPAGLLAIAGVYWLMTFFLRSFLFEPFRIPSMAMAPGLPARSMIVVQKWGYGHYSSFGVTLFRRLPSAPLAHGDVIVFDYPKDTSTSFVQRLVGMPGDVIEIRANGLTLNGVPVARRQLEDYLITDDLRYDKRFEETLGVAKYDILQRSEAREYPYLEDALNKEGCTVEVQLLRCTVPPGHYFFLGDNRDDSNDSRMFGFVRADQIIGKLVWHAPPSD